MLVRDGDACGDESVLYNRNGGWYEYFDGSEDIPQGCAVAAGHRPGSVTLRPPATIHRPSPGIHHVAQTGPFPPDTLFSLFIPTAHAYIHSYSISFIHTQGDYYVYFLAWMHASLASAGGWTHISMHESQSRLRA